MLTRTIHPSTSYSAPGPQSQISQVPKQRTGTSQHHPLAFNVKVSSKVYRACLTSHYPASAIQHLQPFPSPYTPCFSGLTVHVTDTPTTLRPGHTQNPPGISSDDVYNGDPVAIILDLSKPTHQRTLPTLLLYTETGLRIYDGLTTKAADYYLFAAGEEILKKHGDKII